jgi:hypothetical protein
MVQNTARATRLHDEREEDEEDGRLGERKHEHEQ